jgi:hypothetical protein
MSLKAIIELSKARETKIITSLEYRLRIAAEVADMVDPYDIDTLAMIISKGADEEGEG